MIDRSYLPFKSARQYVDRGMAKWMGFFISEHTAALGAEDETIDYEKLMEAEKLALLLGQAYREKLRLVLYTDLRKKPYRGRVQDLGEEKIYFSTEGQVLLLDFSSIISIDLEAGEDHD